MRDAPGIVCVGLVLGLNVVFAHSETDSSAAKSFVSRKESVKMRQLEARDLWLRKRGERREWR